MSDLDTGLMLADTAQRILADLCPPALLRAEGAARREGVDALWNAISAAGLDRALAPEAEGGVGLGWPEVRATIEALGRFGAPVPLAETLAAQALARLVGCALPDGPASLAVARLEAGRVVAAAVPHSGQARWVACSVARGDGGPHRLLVLPVQSAQCTPQTGMTGEDRSRLVWAEADAAIDSEMPAGVSALLAGAAIRTAQIAGACARALEMATGYANDREQFGRPIGKFQALQQQLAVAGEWSAMASMASQLALAGPDVQLQPARVAAAKQVAGTAVETCTAIAHAVHGAIGVTAEYDLQLYTRRLWAWAGEFGSSLYWAGMLGEAVLEDDEPRVWDEVIRLSTLPAA